MRRLLAVLGVLIVMLAMTVPAHADGPRPVRLCVMSYNIQAGIGADHAFDLERTARAIEDQRPDVVGLQEVDVHWGPRSDYADEAWWLARRLRMSVFFAPIYTLPPDRPGAPERRFGLAVLSRYPILRAENHAITRLSTQVSDPRPAPAPGFPEVLINARGAHVWIYDTHLDYRTDPAVRQAQVADMLRIMNDRHRILLGDLNALPDAPELAPLWDGLTDVLAGDDALTWPAEAPVKRLDYVTVSSATGVEVARVPPTLASDHLPVVADVTIPPRGRPPANPPPRG